MAQSPVAKYALTSLLAHQEAVIELLHNFGACQIENWEKKEKLKAKQNSNPEYLLAQVVFALNFLAPYDTAKIPLKKKLLPEKTAFTEKDFNKFVKDFDYEKVVADCEEAEANLNALESTIEKQKSLKNIMAAWINLDFIPKNEIETEKTKIILGSVNENNYDEFLRATEKLKNIAFEKSYIGNREVHFALIYKKELEKNIKDLLVKFDFKSAQIPAVQCQARGETEICQREIIKAEKDKEELANKIKKLTLHLPNLRLVSDYLAWKKEQKEALDKATGTQKTFALLFFMEECFAEVLSDKMAAITPNFALEKMALEEGENPPVVIRNNNLIEPFESVTGIYGMPLPSEPDPTPYLAPFFFIFFGFCVSDAGYGLVISSLMFAMLKISKKPASEMKLIRLLFYGGLSTLIVGALFGSWFGIDISTMSHNWFRQFVEFFKVIDPIKNPLLVLLIAFCFGLIQILTGLLISCFWKIKHKKATEGLLGPGLWFSGLLILILWVLAKVNVLPASLNPFLLYLLLAAVLALIVANGRQTKNIFLKPLLGLYSLYGAVNYLSDTLSYSRLLALGLATGIIAMVINLIAGLAIDMIPFVGYLFAVLILIGGHIFNIAINSLGAFIHSGRLQFVEFFPKFMEGGGSRFRFFKKTSKYLRIINKE
ncbi:MAG: hypothetical protein ABIH38_05370 [Patescibacteria group bacterium]